MKNTALVVITCFFYLIYLNSCKILGLQKDHDDSSDKPDNIVMVVDSSFDPDLPIFENKIIGRYTISCDKTCVLSEGFHHIPVQNQSVLAIKEKLKLAVDSRDMTLLSSSERSQVNKSLVFSHGTATASIIAYRNPGVRLVLVQLANMNDSHSEGSGNILDQCSQPKWKTMLQLAIMQIKTNWSTLNKEVPEQEVILKNLALKHGVQIINKSYGPIGPPPYIRKKLGGRCPELAEYLVLNQVLDQERILMNRLAGKSLPYVILQSSGNEGTKIDSVEDDPYCGRTDDNHFLVGSFNAADGISSFSNYGDCVNFYVLGSQVIAAQPGDILLPVDGTSFSSPLGARITAHMSSSFSSEPFEAELAKNIDDRRFLRAELDHMRRISYETGENLNLSSSDQFTRDVIRAKKEDQFFGHVSQIMKKIESENP